MTINRQLCRIYFQQHAGNYSWSGGLCPCVNTHRPLRYQGRNHGHDTLTVVPGSPSGQQAYKSKVLLQTSPAGENGWVNFKNSNRMLAPPSWIELPLRPETLTCGGCCRTEVVQALVFVAAPLLFHKLQWVSRGELQWNSHNVLTE